MENPKKFQTFSKAEEKSVMKQRMVREFMEYHNDHRNLSMYRKLCTIAPKYGYSPEGLKKLLLRWGCLTESELQDSNKRFINKFSDYATNL